MHGQQNIKKQQFTFVEKVYPAICSYFE